MHAGVPVIPLRTRRSPLTTKTEKGLKSLSRFLPSIPGLLDANLFKGLPAWRVRVGDYRIIYTINDGRLVIAVVTLDHQREAYRR